MTSTERDKIYKYTLDLPVIKRSNRLMVNFPASLFRNYGLREGDVVHVQFDSPIQPKEKWEK